ncbi:ABC transporter permease subunit [Actinocorallia libanotica]|uniref:ABC transporter permease subunit n=1 Tax=Actinocorallia libanotica TaxID=46162 RepID=A0ABP4BTF1_9ACTN
MRTPLVTAPAKTLPRRRPAFRHMVASEWVKLRSVRSTYWTVLACIAVSVGLSGLLSLAVATSWDELPERDRALFDPTSYAMAGTNIGLLVLAALGVLTMTSEYATGTIRASLTAVPDRSRFLAAKALVLCAVAFTAGQVSAFASFLLGQVFFAARDLDVSLGEEGVLRAVAGCGLYLTLVTLLAFGVGILLRHTAAALTLIVGVMFVVPLIAAFLPGEWGLAVRRLIPSQAGSAVTVVAPNDTYLSPPAGLLVFCCYLAAVLVPAHLRFLRHDA